MSERLRVGIVGSGIGEVHLQAYRSLPQAYEVVALCDVDLARAGDLAARYGVPRVVGDVDELCRLEGLDVVDICTPSYLHFEQTLTALGAGKDVICEKPVAGALHEMDELQRAEAESRRRVMPVFQRRFGHGLQRLKYLVDRGVAGRPYLATTETHWRRARDYYAGTWRGRWATELGGGLVTLAIHALDVLCYVLGPASQVWADMAVLVNPVETEDTAVMTLRMASGAMCALSVTAGSASEITRHRFCFANLSAESNETAYENTSEPWAITPDSPAAEGAIAEALAGFRPGPEGMAGQFLRFFDALRSGSEPPVTLADARITIELITAAYEAAAGGCAVALPLGPSHPGYRGWHRAIPAIRGAPPVLE